MLPPPFEMLMKLRKYTTVERKHIYSSSDDDDDDDDDDGDDDNGGERRGDGSGRKDGFHRDRERDFRIQRYLTNCIVSSDSH